MKFFRSVDEINSKDYFFATYEITSSTNLRDAAWNLAIGQSVGNPNIRNGWETESMFENHSCIVVGDEFLLNKQNTGTVQIAFPIINMDFESDGISHLICQLMGGHTDIDIITKCRLIKLELPNSVTKHFLGAKYGITGFRKFTNQYNKPLFGGIVKPKIGITPEILLEMVKKMVDGGVDFIKEDEIMSNPTIAPLDRRVDIISNYLAKQSHKIVFCHTINSDSHIVVDRVKRVYELGGNGVHINVFSGLGVYNSIRKLDLPIYLHFQSSGVKLFTDVNNKFSISWSVICQLATLMGVDTIQTGMIGGYTNDNIEEILECVGILRNGNTMPALSCGMHPGLIDYITDTIGVDYLANAGGSIHGHPNGTTAGARAMRQSIDKTFDFEYRAAIEKWGKYNETL